MKKLFRALMAVMVAVVMSFAIVAFAGCDPEKNPNTPTPEPKPTPGLATGNTVYDQIIDTEFAGAKLVSTTTIDNEPITVNATVNLNGKADIEVGLQNQGYYYFFMRDWAVYGTESDEAVTDFTQAELEGYVDINQAVEALMAFVDNSGVELPEDVTGLIDLDDLGDVVEGTLSGVNYAVLSLADAAGAATEANGNVTVDLNKMIFNIVKDVKSVVNGLTATTTVGDVLNNDTLKKYVQIVTELATPQDIIDAVKEIAETIGDMATAPAATEEDGADGMDESQAMAMAAALIGQVAELLDTVKPDANSTVYDYIVKILSSQELVDLINEVMAEAGAPAGTGLTKKITEFTLGELVTMVPSSAETPVTFESIKETALTYINTYTSGITETKFSVSVEEEELFALTNASLVYTCEAKSLASMKLNLNLTVGDDASLAIDATLNLSKTAYGNSEFATLPATLPDIEDVEIGGNKKGLTLTLENQRAYLQLDSGESVTVNVSIDPSVEILHFYSSEEGILLIESPGRQGAELTIENYGDMTITVYNTSNTTLEFIVGVEEAVLEEFDVPELTLGVAGNFTVAAGESVMDPGTYAYFKITVPETRTYAIELSNLDLTSEETDTISDVWVAVSRGLVEDGFGGYDIDFNYEVMADDGVYTLESGVYYIVVYNMDIDWNHISGTGRLTVHAV